MVMFDKFFAQLGQMDVRGTGRLFNKSWKTYPEPEGGE